MASFKGKNENEIDDVILSLMTSSFVIPALLRWCPTVPTRWPTPFRFAQTRSLPNPKPEQCLDKGEEVGEELKREKKNIRKMENGSKR